MTMEIVNDYHNDYYKRLSNGEFENSENIQISDSLKYTTPKGKIVYGGGGIIPDVVCSSKYQCAK